MKYAPQLNRETWLAQGLILLVTAWNIQSGLAFLFQPERYAPSFMLSGAPGIVAVRGVGLLFLMWNIPYLVALWHPHKYILALQLAVAAQALGLIGESYIFSTLTAEYSLLAASIRRFIAFDAVGLLLLLAALLSVKRLTRS